MPARLDTMGPQLALLQPLLQLHLNSQARVIWLGFQNVRSIGNKIESVVDIIEENRLHIMVMTETWHEGTDSVTIKKL